MLHAGIGATEVNNFLAVMDVSPISTKALKKREREIGPAIEREAKRSCTSALREESSRTLSDCPESRGLTVGYDMGWQKRGKAHNSLTGVGHYIGKHSGKVVGYATRNKRCNTCHFANKRQQRARPHDCRMNWHKSSRAMEADVAVQVAMESKNAGYSFTTKLKI